MTTEAERAKMVELYERFKGADWWPDAYPSDDTVHWFDSYYVELSLNQARAIIGWALVERLTEYPHIVSVGVASAGEAFVRHGDNPTYVQATRFLALAAAVEAKEKA